MGRDATTPSTASPILGSLNAAQCRAVTSDAATVAILAGPGSGKTHTLTSRVAWLVDNVGYQPEDVIVATFTVKAAREMKERIGKALGAERARKVVLGTFHSIARRYLAAYGKRIGMDQKFGIADDGDSRAIISRICKRLQLSVDPPLARAWISKKKAKGAEKEPAGKQQQSGKHAESTRDLETCYDEYQTHLHRSNLLDYDDLLVKCVELLQKCPFCVANVQAVLIDEYQDTNGVQYELMRLFAQQRRRITIVGDPDQSIYGWRSAEIRNLYRLLQDYPNTHEVSLEENYRSSQSILDAALKVIQQDQKRYQKVLLPVHGKGTRPVLRKLRSSAKEAQWIVAEIRRVLLMSGGMVTHDDIAILLRSASLSRHIESALGKSGIAYRMVGGFKFYERAEIKLLLDYLRVIHQPENNDALARIINTPKRGVGDGTVKSLVDEAERASISLWKLLVQFCRGDRKIKSNISKQAEQKISVELIRFIKSTRERIDEPDPAIPYTLVEVIQQLLVHLKFQKYLQDTYPEEHESRWANVEEFTALAGDFMRELDQAGDDSLPDVDGLEQAKETNVLAKFLANVSLASDVQKEDGDGDPKPLVTISTIHAAKGLEWPIVFVPAAYNGSIPHMRSEDGDEERRLLYVAMTRAQALLYLSCPLYSSHGTGEKLELSPFISPIPSGYFAKKGPSFQRRLLDEMGTVLRRDVPSDETIFKSMPLHEYQEDDAFPVDPEQAHEAEQNEASRTYGSFSSDAQRAKRPRLHGPAGSAEHGDSTDWRKGVTTTMDRRAEFTVSALPGFMTAGVHHTATLAEVVPPNGNKQQPPPEGKQKLIRASTNKRPADQSSLLGFFVSQSSNKKPRPTEDSVPPIAAASRPRTTQLQGYGLPAQPTIEPELMGHKLGQPKVKSRPLPPKRDEHASSAHYAQFSSSPPRPQSRTRDVGLGQGTSVRIANENEAPAAARDSRPAISLHKTTFAAAKTQTSFKRPGTGVGIAPMDRLRKPFKPLTVNRS